MNKRAKRGEIKVRVIRKLILVPLQDEEWGKQDNTCEKAEPSDNNDTINSL